MASSRSVGNRSKLKTKLLSTEGLAKTIRKRISHLNIERLFVGGLTAVIWTDFIQTIIMLVGAFYLMIKSKYSPQAAIMQQSGSCFGNDISSSLNYHISCSLLYKLSPLVDI